MTIIKLKNLAEINQFGKPKIQKGNKMKGIIRVFTLSLAIVMAVCSFATADVSLNVPFYSQVDSDWKDEYIIEGAYDKQIEDIGC